MRVAVVHSFYSADVPSGENTVVNAQAEALESDGHRVEIFARNTDDVSGTRLYALESALRTMDVPGVGPAPDLGAFEPDIVHVHNLFPNWSLRWLRRWQDRLVVTLHNYRPICAAATLWRDGHDCRECLDLGTQSALRHRCYRGSLAATAPLAFAARANGRHQPVLTYARRLVTLNSKAREIFAATWGNHRVVTLPNFVDAPQDTDGVARAGWLSAGRLTPEKGVLQLMEAFPAAHRLSVAGQGPLSDQVIQSAQRHPAVDYLGALDHSTLLQRIRASTGFILPSLWSEGIPTVAIEALASGTPLVVSRHCTSAADLTAGGAGVVYDPDDARDLQKAVDCVAADASDFSARARHLHAERYSREVWLDQIGALYEQVAKEAALV